MSSMAIQIVGMHMCSMNHLADRTPSKRQSQPEIRIAVRWHHVALHSQALCVPEQAHHEVRCPFRRVFYNSKVDVILIVLLHRAKPQSLFGKPATSNVSSGLSLASTPDKTDAKESSTESGTDESTAASKESSPFR